MLAQIFVVVTTLLLSTTSHAGVPLSQPVPTLGEAGLIALGVGLVGFGIARLRR
jgi:hypothetical protein